MAPVGLTCGKVSRLNTTSWLSDKVALAQPLAAAEGDGAAASDSRDSRSREWLETVTCIMTFHNEYHEGKGHAGTQGLLQFSVPPATCPALHPSQRRDRVPHCSLNKCRPSPLLPVTSQNQSYCSWSRLQQHSTGRGICICPWALSQDHCSFLGQAQHQRPKGSQWGTEAIGSRWLCSSPQGRTTTHITPQQRESGHSWAGWPWAGSCFLLRAAHKLQAGVFV